MKEAEESQISSLFTAALEAVQSSQLKDGQTYELETLLQLENNEIAAVRNYAEASGQTYDQAHKEIQGLVNIEDDSLPV